MRGGEQRREVETVTIEPLEHEEALVGCLADARRHASALSGRLPTCASCTSEAYGPWCTCSVTHSVRKWSLLMPEAGPAGALWITFVAPT